MLRGLRALARRGEGSRRRAEVHAAQLGVFCLRLPVNGKIGVSVFANVKEFFVRSADRCVIAHQSLCPTELKPGQRAGDIFPAQSGIVDQSLELTRCGSAITVAAALYLHAAEPRQGVGALIGMGEVKSLGAEAAEQIERGLSVFYSFS